MNQKKISIEHIRINDKKYTYKLVSTRNKHIYMRLNKANEIIVSKNRWMTKKMLDEFVKNNIARFDKTISKRNEHLIVDTRNNFITLWDKKYKLVFINAKHKKYEKKRVYIYIYYKKESDKIVVIKNIFKDESTKILSPIVYHYATLMRVKCKKLKYKWLTSKWGHCNYLKKSIELSTQLASFGPKTSEYVVVHELAHLVYPNHSKSFWNLVGAFYSDYKLARIKINSSSTKLD